MMKKTNAIFSSLFVMASALFFTGCGTDTDPVTYNNKLMTIMNDNDKDVNAMNTAMATKDYAKAETVRKTWEDNLEQAITKAGKIEAIKDDEGLKTAVEEGLKGYKTIATDDYKKLIELRTKEKNGDASAQPQIETVLNKINKSFEDIGANVNKAINAFEKKYAK